MSAETTPPVGALLKEFRLAAGLTQETLAERAGISVRSVQAIEGAINRPHLDTARRLADALGLVTEERAHLLAVATPTPRRRAPPAPSAVLAFTAPGAPGPVAAPAEVPSARQGTLRSVRPARVPRNPYKGLRAFRAADAGDFFGRAALVDDLIAAVQSSMHPNAARFLAVVGPSGAGKSSAVLAGLLPQLRHGAVPGSADWVYLDPLLPGAHPLEALSLALAPALPHSPLAAIRADLDASERGLHRLASRVAHHPEARVLLVVDQAEELFTLTVDAEERQQFIALVVTAVREPRGSMLVVLTLRADFYDRPLRYPDLGRLVATQSVAVLPLEPAELRAAIEGPAALPDVGLRFEGALVSDLLDEVRDQAGALPLLQFTLEQLYARRDGNLLTEAAYQELGGVRGALARQAEATYGGLPGEVQRHLARALFLRLIEPGASAQDTARRRAAFAELELADPMQTAQLRAVAEAFIAARLLTAREHGGATTLEVSHEALVGAWGRLGAWVEEARADVRVQVRLSTDAAEWARQGMPEDRLYRGRVLTEAVGWAARNTPSAREEAFLAAGAADERRQSEAERARQARELALARRAALRLRTLVGVLALFLLVAVGLTTFALSTANQAQANAAQSLSRQLAAQAVARLGGQYDLAVLLSLQARTVANTVEARDSLLQSLEAAPPGLTAFLRGHLLGVNSVAISRDGRLLASGSEDGTIRLWDLRQRRAVGPPLAARAGPIWGVAFSPDGTMLAAGDDNGTVRLWDVARHRPLGPAVFAHTGPATPLAFSPDGKTLASAGDDGRIMVWAVTPRGALTNAVATDACLNGQSWALAISPNGKMLANGCTDGTIQLWDRQGTTLSALGTLTGHSGPVFGVAFSPDGTTLASAGSDHTVRLWDVARQREIGVPLTGHSGTVFSVAFSPDGTMLASGGLDALRLWDVRRRLPLGPPLEGHTGDANSVAFSPDGTMLAVGTADSAVALWDVRHRRPLSAALNATLGRVSTVFGSPDGKTLVSVSLDGTLGRVWALTRGALRLQSTIALPVGDQVGGAAFSPGGRLLAVWGGASGMVQLVDAATGRPLGQPITMPGGATHQVVFSPDGTLLASASDDGTVQLWALAGQPTDSVRPLGAPLTRHTVAALAVAFSPDGRVLASGGADALIRLWDVARRRPLGRSLAGHLSSVTALAFSPDGTILASASDDRTVRLWNVARRRPQGPPLIGHTDIVLSVAFSHDGTILASGSTAPGIRLWDVASGQPLGAPLDTGQSGFFDSLAFTSGRTTLVAGSGDGSVRMWELDLSTWPRQACQIANRNLTQLEWQQYLGNLPYQKTCPGLPPGS